MFQPSVGSFHILDDAILSEFVRFRDKADSEGRADLLPQIDAEISRYHRTRKFKSVLGLSNLDARLRVMKHRMRYRGIRI